MRHLGKVEIAGPNPAQGLGISRFYTYKWERWEEICLFVPYITSDVSSPRAVAYFDLKRKISVYRLLLSVAKIIVLSIPTSTINPVSVTAGTATPRSM